jgi:hypothetical protein
MPNDLQNIRSVIDYWRIRTISVQCLLQINAVSKEGQAWFGTCLKDMCMLFLAILIY